MCCLSRYRVVTRALLVLVVVFVCACPHNLFWSLSQSWSTETRATLVSALVFLVLAIVFFLLCVSVVVLC